MILISSPNSKLYKEPCSWKSKAVKMSTNQHNNSFKICKLDWWLKCVFCSQKFLQYNFLRNSYVIVVLLRFFMISYAFWKLTSTTDKDTKGLNLPFMAVCPYHSNSFSLYMCTVSLNPEFVRKLEKDSWCNLLLLRGFNYKDHNWVRQKIHTIFRLFSKILAVEQACSNWGWVVLVTGNR